MNFNTFQKQLQASTSIASLAFFRMAFGAIMLWEVCRYFHYGWIDRYWIRPDFYFTYPGFDWISPWEGNGMYLHFMFLGVLAIFILLGFCYRIASALFFLGFTYIFLLDQANYLNHFYLISLLSFLLILVPANKNYSLDAALRPNKASDTIPLWALRLVQFQMAIPYIYGGIAKINHDWLRGEPMQMWLKDSSAFPFIGPYLTMDGMALFFSYSGLLLDLLIVPFLIWKRTRLFAFVAITLFHLTNSQLFHIGIFPWFMIAATTIFFEPDWCKNIIARFYTSPTSNVYSRQIVKKANLKWGGYALGIYIAWQLLFPFRHILIPGNVHWTEEGHIFSWHMKLRDKRSKATFYVKDLDSPNAKEWKIKNKRYLSKRQRSKMATRPLLIYQYAHHLKEVYQKEGYENVQVRAEINTSLNGRPRQLLVDPFTDLAAIDQYTYPGKWINPLYFSLGDKDYFTEEPIKKNKVTPVVLEESQH